MLNGQSWTEKHNGYLILAVSIGAPPGLISTPRVYSPDLQRRD
jgi:hypothetical protein